MIQLTGYDVTVEDVYKVAYSPEIKVGMAESALQAMKKSRDYIEGRLASGEVMYGVNTGFGAFSSVRISDSQIEELQRNLIRSHSMGVGIPFTKAQTRAIMFLRANTIARGHSGIRPLVAEKILEFLNNDIIPVVPSQGSVGASGDLAPLSHLALTIIGEGEAWSSGSIDPRPVPVQDLLKQKNITPLTLKAKEGLSMINGCQVMTAVGMLALHEARNLAWCAELAGAMSLEGLRGSRKAFDPLIAATRNHPGEAKTARNLLKILGTESPISKSHDNCNKVQDAYSLRCMPAVHGAFKDTLGYAWKVLETEANSSTDNPLVFADEDKVLSCGNFHGMPVAYAMDYMGIAISSLVSMSECRIQKLINPAMSELPAFLSPNGGLNSGHMIVQVAAASLVSENKVLSHPACVDTIPTSADKEDHVSMGTIAARKFVQILENGKNIVAMELLSGAQAIDLLLPLAPAGAVQSVHQKIRQDIPFAKEDRIFSKDVQKMKSLIDSGEILKTVQKSVGELEW